MKIARFWEKATEIVPLPSGKNSSAIAWGWSANSREDAARNARDAAQRVAQMLQTRQFSNRQKEYGYPDRPPREEILREIFNSTGEVTGLLTRNSYGSQVLSTPDLMFIDVDIPFDTIFAKLSRFVQNFIGRKVEAPIDHIQHQLLETATRHSRYTFRLYRTFGGFRCIVINQVMNSKSADSSSLLEGFGADELYKKLCDTQQCYRARLTPKYWRCGAGRPPNRFPWESNDDERKYRKWQRDYEAHISRFAVCRFMEQVGRHDTLAELQPLIALHDEATKASSSLPLA